MHDKYRYRYQVNFTNIGYSYPINLNRQARRMKVNKATMAVV